MTRLLRFIQRNLHHDLTPIIIVMLMLRLLAIIALRMGGYVAETGPDTAYYMDWGRLSAGGAYPVLNYWIEYPPLFPWLSVLAYKLATLIPAWIDQRFWFNLILHAFILPFEAANVALIYALARRITDHATAIKSAWLYATLFVPIYVLLGWFESLALFTVLLALWAILSNRSILAGLALGVGALIKPYVAITGAVALTHLRPIKKIAPLILAGAISAAIILSPFLIKNPIMLKATLDSILTRSAWSSPYALIDGIYTPTSIRLADRFDPTLANNATTSRVPWAAVTLVFGLIYGLTLFRSTKHQTARAAIGLAAFTFTLFLLWSKGYSVQWSIYLMAFLCILLPDLLGVLLLLILEALFVLEWPIGFILLNGDHTFLTNLIIVRTLVLSMLAAFFAATIFIDRNSTRWQQTRRAIKIAGSIGLLITIGLAISVLPTYATQRYQADDLQPAIELIKSSTTSDRANILFDQPATSERLSAYLSGWNTLAALPNGGAIETWSSTRVQDFSHERRELWYIIDFSAKQQRAIDLDRQLSTTLCKVSTEFTGLAQISRFVTLEPTNDLNVGANFDDGLQINGALINQPSAASDATICIELHWLATQTPSTDYTVFVHVLNAQGQLVAQSDLQPGGGFAPTSQWKANSTLMDRHGIILPTPLSAGAYQIIIGLYDDTGTRLKNNFVGSPEPDSVLLTKFTIP
jgi:hypothetical protein